MSRATSTPGVVEWFEPGDRDHVERALRQMSFIGATRLRTHISWAEFHGPAGADWYGWLLPRLAAQVEVLPCIHYTPPSLSETGAANGPPRRLRDFADFVDVVLDRHGDSFEAIELWNEPNNLLDWDWRVDTDWQKFCAMVGDAAYWAQHRGWRVALGGPCPHDLNWLRMIGDAGVLGVVDAVGVHGFPGTWDSEEGLWTGWPALIESTRELVDRYNQNAEIWITEAGYSTWTHGWAEQARRYLETLDAPADRLYWYALADLPPDRAVQEGLHFDQRHYHLGMFDDAGAPKLLARLVHEGGTPMVRKTLDLARSAPGIVGRKPILITGGAGFIGSNLADRLASEDRDVLVYDALSRPGTEMNLTWLKDRHPRRVSAALCDIRDRAALSEAVRDASAVFHFAAQVAVTTSLADPRQDFEINLGGTFDLLEAVRARRVPLVFASTNKVYGDLADIDLGLEDEAYRPVDAELRAHGVSEDRPLDFHTPYGCSKGGADQYVLDYARSYGLPVAVLRMSCIYGERQFGTEDQGWVAHFLIRALRGEPITVFGDGCQVRDILHVGDAVQAYLGALHSIEGIRGRAFNLGGGPANAVSLRQVLSRIEALVGRPLDLRFEPWRKGDQRYFVSDTRRAAAALQMRRPLDWQDGLERLRDWLASPEGPLGEGGRGDVVVSPREADRDLRLAVEASS